VFSLPQAPRESVAVGRWDCSPWPAGRMVRQATLRVSTRSQVVFGGYPVGGAPVGAGIARRTPPGQWISAHQWKRFPHRGERVFTI